MTPLPIELICNVTGNPLWRVNGSYIASFCKSHTVVTTAQNLYGHFGVFIILCTGNPPVAMSNIPVYDTVQDPVSDKVKMETNPAYQVLTSDQVKMEPNPAYQELSSHSGRANVSKQKPAGDVKYYEDIINDQNVNMTENPSYAVP